MFDFFYFILFIKTTAFFINHSSSALPMLWDYHQILSLSQLSPSNILIYQTHMIALDYPQGQNIIKGFPICIMQFSVCVLSLLKIYFSKNWTLRRRIGLYLGITPRQLSFFQLYLETQHSNSILMSKLRILYI